MSRVAIIDYGSGNIFSLRRAVERCGADCVIASDAKSVISADRIIIPGVGAFGKCMEQIRKRGFDDATCAFISSGRPVLGICVGMQVLFDVSEEFGEHAGLGIIPGRVQLIPSRDTESMPLKCPHIAWTALTMPDENAGWAGTVLADVSPGAEMYFLHSYNAQPEDASHRLADASYGGRHICAAVQRDAVTGCQFHPERSGRNGLAVLQNFLAM